MKIQLKQYKHEKVEISSVDFELPEETVYFFETHIRRSIRIKPVFTTWQKEKFQKEEELYYFDVTCVYLSSECKIEKFKVYLTSFPDATYATEKKFNEAWTQNWFDPRTKEQFEVDLDIALEQIKK